MLNSILEKISFSYFFHAVFYSGKVKNSGGMFIFDKKVFKRLSIRFYKTLKYEITIFLSMFLCVCGSRQEIM